MKSKCIALAAGAMFLADAVCRAASVTLTANAPAPGTNDTGINDIYNFSGASHDGANVCDGGTFADGWANAGFTNLMNPLQSQSFFRVRAY